MLVAKGQMPPPGNFLQLASSLKVEPRKKHSNTISELLADLCVCVCVSRNQQLKPTSAFNSVVLP